MRAILARVCGTRSSSPVFMGGHRSRSSQFFAVRSSRSWLFFLRAEQQFGIELRRIVGNSSTGLVFLSHKLSRQRVYSRSSRLPSRMEQSRQILRLKILLNLSPSPRL